MISVVNIRAAKAQLSRLVDRASRGEKIVIAKCGKPVARLVPVAAAPKRRVPGSARGQIIIHDNFDDPLPDDILDGFYK